MKQVLQSLKDGSTQLVEVPTPGVRPGHVLVRTERSLISAGTERMLVEFGKGGWLAKARQQPDKVRDVLAKVASDGVVATLDAVRSKLDQPLSLGYCNAGTVVEVGSGVPGIAPGDRVVSNGNHAEYVLAPKNLCAKIPSGVGSEAAAFTVLGAIGLQGIRLLRPTLGECFAVTGLGLIGLMVVQMLRAQGCRVLGIDFNEERLALARSFGAQTVNPAAGEDPLDAARAMSGGHGIDGVIITASTSSNEPMRQAAQMCRKRGRIVLVGVVGLELSRADFYEKELTFQVSCSYGPGRYDESYEQHGQDYPLPFVRWTEQRNFEAVLGLIETGSLDVARLVSHRFPIERSAEAFGLLLSEQDSLGIVLEYPAPAAVESGRTATVDLAGASVAPSGARVAFIGAGNYAGRTLMPAFRKAGATMATVVSGGGVSGVHFGRKFGFERASTDYESVLQDGAVDAVVIATRHDAHARQVIAAIEAGKHVFCEKPLCLTLPELERIEATLSDNPGSMLMVGFNRRFAPQVVKMKALLAQVRASKSFIMTVNAGAIPADHWTQQPDVGGGRIVGEACHFIDLLRHLAGSRIVDHSAAALGAGEAGEVGSDKVAIGLRFEDGSIGTIHYLANGHKAVPKERLEVFAEGRVLQLNNFRRLSGKGWPRFRSLNLWSQDKGADACAAAFVQALRTGGPAPIPLEEVLESSRLAIQIQDSLA